MGFISTRGAVSLLGFLGAVVASCSSPPQAIVTQGDASFPLPNDDAGILPDPRAAGDATPQGFTGDIDAGPGGPSDAFAACATGTVAAARLPVDIYIMLDKSYSMTDRTDDGSKTKFEAVKSAIESFVNAPEANGIGVGLQYFPLRKPDVPATCSNSSQCASGGPCFNKVCFTQSGGPAKACNSDFECSGAAYPQLSGKCVSTGRCQYHPDAYCPLRLSDGSPGCCADDGFECTEYCVSRPSFVCAFPWSCDANLYATPAVSIETLPAAKQAILSSLNAAVPDGFTPTHAALGGAVQQAQQYAAAHPDHVVVALLATDGLPYDCDTNIDNIAQLAQNGFTATPSVKTFVIGVFKQSEAVSAKALLDKIASKGGTGQALIVSTSANVSQTFLAALDQIRGNSLPCEFSIPAANGGQTLDYGKINVEFTDPKGQQQSLGYAGSESGCANGTGWYYDVNPEAGAPSRVKACPESCKALGNGGSIRLVLGCATIPVDVK